MAAVFVPRNLDDLSDVAAPSPADGDSLVWDDGAGAWVPAAVSAGGSGTVTSVALTVPSGLSVSGSPVTGSGTLAVTTALTGIVKAGAGAFTAAVAGTDYVTPAALTAHTGNTSNPHSVTANQVLPSQTGNSGKYLTTNGTDSSWATVSGGSPGGSDGQIQVNNAGAFGGATGIYTNISGSLLTVTQATGSEAPFRARGTGGATIAGFDSSGFLLGPAGVKLFHGGASTAYDNMFIGYSVGNATLSGTNNVGVGLSILNALTSGQNNFGFGLGVLTALTTGTFNVVIGLYGARKITTGQRNTIMGYYAGENLGTSGSFNTLIGCEVCKVATGNDNVGVGCFALSTMTSGTSNVGVGSNAGYSVTSGAGNTLLGYSTDVTSGSLTKAVAIGYGAQVGASNTLVLGSTGTDYVRVVIGATTGSALFNVKAKSATDTASFLDTSGTRQSGVDVDGAICLKAGSGAPGFTPTYAGATYFDYTNNLFYGWNGSAWKSVALT